MKGKVTRVYWSAVHATQKEKKRQEINTQEIKSEHKGESRQFLTVQKVKKKKCAAP